VPIVNKSGEIKPHIFLVDTMQLNQPRIAASFIFWDKYDCVLMDVGTSDNVANLLRMLRKFEIPLEKIRCIINTHYHFDHGGGSLALWRKLSQKNPQFKIWTPQLTHDYLQNAQDHLEGAHTTFGDFVGTMDPIPENGFKIISPNTLLPLDLQNGITFQLIPTPGHSADHVSPTIFQDGKVYFCFSGEGCGTLMHSTKLVSLATSMPPNFNYQQYMASVQKIYDLHSDCLGFCHMGAILGTADVESYILDHLQYMEAWRNRVRQLYQENPSTRYILDNTSEFWQDRVDFGDLQHPVFQNLRLALTYGLMIDLGFRQPKYERKKV
jgi:glyoxylase-like metal-dependent hydrolase (beta-lactamase superfamily II)